MKLEELRTQMIIEGDKFPQPVKIISYKMIGQNRVQIEVVGVNIDEYHKTLIITLEDLATFKEKTPQDIQFLGKAEWVFLYLDIRFLLADDPGAGKTIMGGLLIKELKYRGLVNRVLIVVPGHLKAQWLREMKERFNETFLIIDRGVLNASWGQNVWTEFPQVVTSLDFLKQNDIQLGFNDARWDLVIVDEAHKMSAYKYGDKVSKTARYEVGETLSTNSKYLLLLTATPHRGDPENFRLFLDLLQPNFFANTEMLATSARVRRQ